MIVYILLGFANLLVAISLIIAIIDAFKSKKKKLGIIMILLPIILFYYYSNFTSQKLKKISKYMLITGFMIGLMTISYSLLQDFLWWGEL